MKRPVALGLAACLGLPALAVAGVDDVTDSGFAVSGDLLVGAPKDEVWDLLIQPGRWWTHGWFGDTSVMTLDPVAGGCWCEIRADGRQAEHMRVITVDPAATLRLKGALGPLQETGATGHLTWTLSESGDGTQLSWSYQVGGYMTGGFGPIAPAVDRVLAEMAGNLKREAESSDD